MSTNVDGKFLYHSAAAPNTDFAGLLLGHRILEVEVAIQKMLSRQPRSRLSSLFALQALLLQIEFAKDMQIHQRPRAILSSRVGRVHGGEGEGWNFPTPATKLRRVARYAAEWKGRRRKARERVQMQMVLAHAVQRREDKRG